jgi:hypothetical protein
MLVQTSHFWFSRLARMPSPVTDSGAKKDEPAAALTAGVPVRPADGTSRENLRSIKRPLVAQ